MSKGILSTTSDIVNGIWGVGTEVYNAVSEEVSQAVVDEAMDRTKKHFKGKDVSIRDEAFLRYFQQEKLIVEKEFKGMAVKGGLFALGIGFFF